MRSGRSRPRRSNARIVALLAVALIAVAAIGMRAAGTAVHLPGAPDSADQPAAQLVAPIGPDQQGGSAAPPDEPGHDLPAAAAPAAPDPPAPSVQGALEMTFLDVGQGDCTLVSCDGHHLLIDGGPPSASQKVYAVLKARGIDHLDAIVATHPDADHIGGISAALNAATAGALYCSVAEGGTRTFQSMVRYASECGLQVQVPQVPTSFALGGATVSIIGPAASFDDDNNGSLVCRFDFGGVGVLVMADAEAEAELALVDAAAVAPAQVLRVGHHGSHTSTTDELLDTVHPTWAVISCGADNPYGHPHAEVLERLQAAGATVLRTDMLGDITLTTDGTEIIWSESAR